jgi:hypothetical protein
LNDGVKICGHDIVTFDSVYKYIEGKRYPIPEMFVSDVFQFENDEWLLVDKD